MKKEDFLGLFLEVLNSAAEAAEARLSRPVSRCFVIELHALGLGGKIVGVEDAIGRIFLSEDRFYRMIDVGVRRLLSAETQVFVRVSGHSPGTFDETWSPSECGPFKQIEFQIEDIRD